MAGGSGAGELRKALRRWRRGPAESSGSVRELALRLDDKGCAYGRVGAARLDDLARAYERLETKLNAVLLAVVGTFISSMIGLVIYYLRQ